MSSQIWRQNSNFRYANDVNCAKGQGSPNHDYSTSWCFSLCIKSRWTPYWKTEKWLDKSVVRNNNEKQEVCNAEQLKARCPEDSAIVIKSAVYGRMKLGRCLEVDAGYLGCQNDVLWLADRWCSGRQLCDVYVPNDELKQANDDLITIDRDHCQSATSLGIHGNDGYISSLLTTQTGCGSRTSPWIIDVSSGQTVDIKLLDFGALSRHISTLTLGCPHIVGFIVERSLGSNFTICGDNQREKHIYSSKTNKLEIVLLSQYEDDTSSSYLIYFKVIGCSDLTPPAHAWYKREGNEAVIGCKSNDKIWRLYCNGNTWDGVVGNCSMMKKGFMGKDNVELPFTSVIFLTCVVCGALLLIIIVVVAGAVYVKKQSIRHELRLRSEYASLTLSSTQYLPVKLPGYDVTMSRPTHAQHNEDNQPLVEISERTSTLSKVTPGMRTIEDNQFTTLPGGRQGNNN
ncbi:hypothetical protein LSH36_1776g00007 [Paralvinella palmiformis]|uniref:SUEL-type lectin domain-containing protein n=1 Tax=Paralvinella palmiformis TaxID=53620 RepID=A0AAD9ISY6_9ANNE|nr:hypothetical protein LSH36_1776g00007 [Paralvinella palmiformis]